jgi:hypothetical protein
VFTSTPVTAATEDVHYNYAITATDADGDPLTITSQGTPAWLTFAAGANAPRRCPARRHKRRWATTTSRSAFSDGSGAQVQQNFTIVRRERQRSAGVHQHTGDHGD